MKKIFVLASLFAAAAMISCEKNENLANEEANSTITVIAKTPAVDTRTIVTANDGGGYSVTWDSNSQECIKLGYFNTSTKGNNGRNALPLNIIDENTASFSIDQKGGVPSTAVILYPLSAAKVTDLGSAANPAAPCHQGPSSHFYLNVPAEQTSSNTPDAGASLMFASVETDGNGMDGYTEAQFKHIMAYGKLNFKNLPAEGTIEKVKFTVNDADARLTGGLYAYDWANDKIETDTDNNSDDWTINTEAQPATTVNNSVTVTPNGESSDIWFAVIPSYGKSYTSITVEVTIDGATYTKTATVTDGVQFNVGKVRPINVDMTGATTK